MAERKTTFTLCDLYDAFKSAEALFSMYADVLAAIRCGGFDCGQTIEAPESIREAVNDIIGESAPGGSDGGGGIPCQGSPCPQGLGVFQDKALKLGDLVPALVQAVPLVVKKSGLKEVQVMTRTVGKKR